MAENLPGVFSASFDDKHRVNPDIVVDDSTIAGADPSDPLLRDTLISAGGAFFRAEVDLTKDSHGLNKLQLATSDSSVRHGECFQLLELKTPEEQEAVREAGREVEEMALTWRGQQIVSHFVKVPLLTRDQLLDELAQKPATALERQCVAMGVKPEELADRLPYQGRGGIVLLSKANKYTGTRLDGSTAREIEDLFQVCEEWRLYGENKETLGGLATGLKMTVGEMGEVIGRIRAANLLRTELLEFSSGETLEEEEDDEDAPSRFPRPLEFQLPYGFECFDSYETFKAGWAKDAIPSLDELRNALPEPVSRKVKWPKLPQSPREFWGVVCDAFEALQTWEDKRFQDWQARCSDGWETLGMVASAIPGGLFGQTEDEELGEVDSPMTYFQNDEIEVRPRQGLLSQPVAETDEELQLGDLSLRIKASVSTPKDRMVFMGDDGPGTAEVPWAKMNQDDKPGLPTKFRGHPLAFYLDTLMQLAAQPRDPVAIELIQEAYEVKRVTVAELLYGRHPGYHAARGLRQEIRRLERGVQKLNRVIPYVQSPADRRLLEEDLQAALEQIVTCEDLLPEQEKLEAQWRADVEAGVKSYNKIVPRRMRVNETGRFITVQSYLVNPVYKWDRKQKGPKLVSGEYWIPQEKIVVKGGTEFNTRVTVHSYPVANETGHTVSLWYLRDNKVVLVNSKDPLLVEYGPSGPNPMKKVHFRSHLDAEVARLGLRKTPWLDEYYRIGYRLVRDVFPDAVRWAQALSDDWHEGVENATQVDDQLAVVDHKGRTVQTQVRFVKPEGKADVIEVQSDREDLFLAMWEELRHFQDLALDKAIKANHDRYLYLVVKEMKYAYTRISINPEWAWRKNQESGWSFQERVLKAGGVLDRALARVRENPYLPGLGQWDERPTSDEHWRAFGYLGCERPVSFVGTMVADRLYHANPGLSGFRQTDQGKRWQKPTAFEAWRFSEGPLGRLKNAIYSISYPKAGLEFLTPSLELVRELEVEEATLIHLREQVQVFLGRADEKVVRQLFGLLGIPTYGEADEVALIVKVNQLLEADKQPQSELETLVRQLWVQEPKARDEILEDLLSKEGRRIYGARLWPMLRDFGVLREDKVRPDPSCNRLSFCEPYVRAPAERLAW